MIEVIKIQLLDNLKIKIQNTTHDLNIAKLNLHIINQIDTKKELDFQIFYLHLLVINQLKSMLCLQKQT